MPLVKVGAVSQHEYDNTVQEVLGQPGRGGSGSGETSPPPSSTSDWTRITSPIDGVAGITQAQIGDLISPATVMTTVSQVDPIKVYFPISEQEYLKFADGIEHFRRTGDASTAPTLAADPRQRRPLPAQRASRRPSTGRSSRRPAPSRSSRCSTTRTTSCAPASYARVRAVTESLKNALVVPQRAVQEVQGNHQVAVVAPDDTVEIRRRQGGSAVRGTDWVITDGRQARRARGRRGAPEGARPARRSIRSRTCAERSRRSRRRRPRQG